jgi:hypothetical protein
MSVDKERIRNQLLGVEDIIIINPTFMKNSKYFAGREGHIRTIKDCKTGETILRQNLQGTAVEPLDIVYNISKISDDIVITGVRGKKLKINSNKVRAMQIPSEYELVRAGKMPPKRKCEWDCAAGYNGSILEMVSHHQNWELGKYEGLFIYTSEGERRLSQFCVEGQLLLCEYQLGDVPEDTKVVDSYNTHNPVILQRSIVNLQTGKEIFKGEAIDWRQLHRLDLIPDVIMRPEGVYTLWGTGGHEWDRHFENFSREVNEGIGMDIHIKYFARYAKLLSYSGRLIRQGQVMMRLEHIEPTMLQPMFGKYAGRYPHIDWEEKERKRNDKSKRR